MVEFTFVDLNSNLKLQSNGSFKNEYVFLFKSICNLFHNFLNTFRCAEPSAHKEEAD